MDRGAEFGKLVAATGGLLASARTVPSVGAVGRRGSVVTKKFKVVRTSLSVFEVRPDRKYENSSLPALWSSARFFVPLLLLVVYFAVIYTTSIESLQAAQSVLVLSAVANSRHVLSRMAMGTVRLGVRTPGPLSDPTINLILTTGGTLLDRFEWTHHFLSYSRDPNAPEPTDPDLLLTAPAEGCGSKCAALSSEVNDAVSDMLNGNACRFLATHGNGFGDTTSISAYGFPFPVGPFNRAACESWNSGLMTRGVNGVVKQYAALGRALVERRKAFTVGLNGIGVNNRSTANGYVITTYSAKDEFVSHNMELFLQASSYLTACFNTAQQMYMTSSSDALLQGSRLLTIFTAVAMTMFVLYMMLVFIPMLHQSNQELHKQRGLLLLLPPQVVQTVPTIRALVHHILTDAGITH